MNRHLYLYTFVAALGGLLFGFDTAVINGALPFFRSYFGLGKTLEGWAVSSAIFGCIAGAIAIGYFSDRFGRRNMLMVMALLFLASAIGVGLSVTISGFIAFRVVGGIAIGGASVLSPMYISEIAPARYRGRLAITFQLAIVIGILLAFAADLALINTGINNWRWMFISGSAPALVFLVLLFFVDRSPRWLVRNGNIEQAGNILQKLNPTSDNSLLLGQIRQSIDNEVIGHVKFLFRKPYLRLVLTGMAVGMFNQFTGIAVVMIYSSEIFRSAGFSTGSAILQTVLVGATNLSFTLLAMALIDRLGRKPMLLTGALGMGVFLLLFSVVFYFDIRGIMPLVFMICFVACFAFSQGAVIWVLLAEMFPTNIWAKGSSIGSFSHWIFYALLLFIFPVIRESFASNRGIAWIFAFFSVMTFYSYFFFKKHLVETRGKSLENLEQEFIGH